MSLFRPTAHKYARNLCCLVALCLGLAALSSTQASAAVVKPPPPLPSLKGVTQAPAKGTVEPAVCPGQTFSQPFTGLGDSNWYTLVAGSEFTAASEGWELRNGASIVADTRPERGTGGVLNLPLGSYAVSPPTCVTLQYPTARIWVRSASGLGGVTVGVYYAGSRYGTGVGQPVAQLGDTRGAWRLSNPFDVKPEMTGDPEGMREVRFIFANLTGTGTSHVWGLFVDPRMR